MWRWMSLLLCLLYFPCCPSAAVGQTSTYQINFTDSWKNWCWLSEKFWTQLRTRLDHVGLAEWARGHVGCQTIRSTRLGFLFSGAASTKAFPCDLDHRLCLSFGTQEGSKVLACMLDMVMPHLCIWVSPWCVPASFHFSSREKHVLLPGPISENWRTGLATLWIHRSLWWQPKSAFLLWFLIYKIEMIIFSFG